MDTENICYHEKSQLEAKMKVKKPHKESFYVDEKDGFTYCGVCEENFVGTSFPREFSRLIESKRHYVNSRIGYPSDKAKPLRHNQTITNEHLESKFREIEGKYVKIEDLKFIWGPSYENPAGFIKVNDSNKSTTVVSSSYLRRLGNITSLVWTQQRAEGDNGEKLVIFRETKEKWINPREKANRKRLEKLKLLNLEEKWEKKLAELKYDLGVILAMGQRPEWDPSDDLDYGYYGDSGQKDKKNDISEIKLRISKIQEGLGRRVTVNDKNYLDRIKREFSDSDISEEYYHE